MTVGDLMAAMVPDQPFAVFEATWTGEEVPLYVGDGTDEDVDEVLGKQVCNFQAYGGLVFIIV